MLSKQKEKGKEPQTYIVLSIIIFISFISSITSYSQPRVNNSTTFSTISQSKIISNPVGWSFDTHSEKWCGYYGLCNSTYERNSVTPKKLTSNTLSGFNDRGIYSLQTKKIKTDDDNIFYLLYHIYWDGEYDYPAIEVGWRVYKTCKVWLITEDEYKKLINPEIGINTISMYDWTVSSPYPTQSSIDWLNTNINKMVKDATVTGKPSKPRNSGDYKWYVKLEDDGNTVRFLLPTYKQLWSEAEKINKENEIKKSENQFYHYVPTQKYHCVDFNEEYFEISRNQYDGLIIK